MDNHKDDVKVEPESDLHDNVMEEPVEQAKELSSKQKDKTPLVKDEIEDDIKDEIKDEIEDVVEINEKESSDKQVEDESYGRASKPKVEEVVDIELQEQQAVAAELSTHVLEEQEEVVNDDVKVEDE